ncbi:MAG: hypothetical protein ACAI38_09040 [Myxococcota bacterium]
MSAGRLVVVLCLAAGCVRNTPPPAKPAENHPRPLPPPPKNATLAKGNAAQTRGDLVAASRIFAAIPESDGDHAAAQKALEGVQPDVTAIAQTWLRHVDRNIKQERFQAACKRLEYLFNNFNLDEATRQAVEQRLVVADQGVAGARANLEELDKQAAPLIASGDHAGALKTLRRAMGLARDIAPDTLLDRERIIAALEQRVAVTAKAVETPSPPVSEKRGRKRRRGEKEPAAVSPPVASAGTAAAADEPESEGASEGNRLRDLLEEAQTFLENKAYFNAIVDFSRARELDRGNETARAALAQLEPKRQELVQQYLETANRYFLQQDLESAVPYFRRVMLLEPDNEQAKKGLEMHYNLERIRRERNSK